jgi:uncharacterized cupin superfamily protein
MKVTRSIRQRLKRYLIYNSIVEEDFMKKFLISFCILLIAVACVPLAALDGLVVTVNGKVEFQDKAGTWKALKSGDTLISGTMISTGFKSEATVKLGASILTIKPLTRMTLTQLVEKEDTVDTELYLEVGNVKAEVNSLNNKKNGFTVKSPVATASVRGTVFEMGEKFVILQGSVEFSTPRGQKRIGKAGQELKLVSDSMASPIMAMQERMETIVLFTTPSTEITSAVRATNAGGVQAPPVATAAPIVVPITRTTVALTLN